jgi:hypothetical protein
MTFLEILGIASTLVIVIFTILCWPLVKITALIVINKLLGRSWYS